MLILAGSPIGDLGDASARLAEVLATADIIAAEDTRRLQILLTRLGIPTAAQIVSYFEGNEAQRSEQLLEQLHADQTVVLLTDAGMPGISDPGYRLVAAAAAADLPITCVPGPSAPLAALVVSGLPVDRFCFEGFLARKAGERRRRLVELASERRTMIFFEAPHRLSGFLADAAAAFGDDRAASVSRELTKKYEETRRGSLAELAAWAETGVRGEITVVIAGARSDRDSSAALAAAVAAVAERTAQGEHHSQVTAAVAAEFGLRRSDLYAATLAARKQKKNG